MHDFDKIEKYLQVYPFHQYPRDIEHFNGDIIRLDEFKKSVLSTMEASEVVTPGDKEITSKSSTKTTQQLIGSFQFDCAFPANRTPHLFEIDSRKSITQHAHDEKVNVSVKDLSVLIDADRDEFFHLYFRTISASFLKTLATCHRAAAGTRGKTICFITRRCFFVVKKVAKTLKAMGYTCVLISLEDVINPDDYNESFHLIVSGVENYVFLQLVMTEIKADMYYVQAMMWDYVLPKIVGLNKDRAKLACEFYDITGIYALPGHLKSLWPEFVVDADLQYENFIFDNADLVLSRFNHKLIEEYRGVSQRNHVEIQPTSCPDTAASTAVSPNQTWIQNLLRTVTTSIVSKTGCSITSRINVSRWKEASRNKLNPRQVNLVYLGNLIPRNESHPRNLFPLWGMPEAWAMLLKQDFCIHVYNSPFRNFDEQGLEHINELASRHQRLTIHEGLPHGKIIHEIRKFDFGINLTALETDSTLNSDFLWRGAMGTKMFTYLEGGLPVLINREFGAMSKFVEDYGIGCPVTNSEIQNLYPIINKINYPKIRSNVMKFNEEHSFERYNRSAIDRLNVLLAHSLVK